MVDQLGDAGYLPGAVKTGDGGSSSAEINPFNGEKPKDARGINAMLEDNADRQIQNWNSLADRIDRLYSQGASITSGSLSADGEFSLFWANVEVMKPSIYSRKPEPVVQPKFKDPRKDRRVTSEVLERTITSIFDGAGINEVMMDVRDDLVIVGRGCIWVTYDDKEKRVYIDSKDRKDFRHQPAKKWCDVGWVSGRSWLTKEQAKKRFGARLADMLAYETDRQDRADGGEDYVPKAGVWETWSRENDRVYWTHPNCEEILDDAKPHLDLESFFPCPKPAYSGTIRRTLVPQPDFVYYEPQIIQINELTERIHSLCDSLRVKGFFPSGGDVGTAVSLALSMDDDAKVLIPINAAVLGNADISKMLVWLPLAEIASTIQTCIEVRTQLIEDVQQLMGIADIMRADTQAEETLGAQKLKVQYGSVRIRDKVQELVRIARDTTAICADIIATKFSKDMLLEHSQMLIPTNADIKKTVNDLKKQAQEETEALGKQAEDQITQMQQGGAPQEAMQQVEQQFQQQLQAVTQKYQPQLVAATEAVTIEMVMDLLRDEKARPFVFDIETDSTVFPDEQQEKQDRNEFLQAFSGAGQTLAPMVETGPEGAELAGAILKFVLGPYRAGRELEMLTDKWVQSMAEKAGKDGKDGAQEKMAEANQMLAKAEQEKAKAAIAKVQADAASDAQQLKARIADLVNESRQNQEKIRLEQQKTIDNSQKTKAQIDEIYAKIDKMSADIRIAEGGQKIQAAQVMENARAAQQRESMDLEKTEYEWMEGEREKASAEDQRQRDNEAADVDRVVAEDQRQFDNQQRIEDRKANELPV